MWKNLKENNFLTRGFWYTIGMLSLGMAYVGFVTPGIPFSIFLVFSAYCFTKSSPRMHAWIYNHKHFGPFLTNWTEKRIFPTRLKYAMIIVMGLNLAVIWFLVKSFLLTFWVGVMMILVSFWAWRFPGSEEEWKNRNKINDLT